MTIMAHHSTALYPPTQAQVHSPYSPTVRITALPPSSFRPPPADAPLALPPQPHALPPCMPEHALRVPPPVSHLPHPMPGLEPVTLMQQQQQQPPPPQQQLLQQQPLPQQPPQPHQIPPPPTMAAPALRYDPRKRYRSTVVRTGERPVLRVLDFGEFRFAYRNLKKKPNEVRPHLEVGDEVECRLTSSRPPKAVSLRLLKRVPRQQFAHDPYNPVAPRVEHPSIVPAGKQSERSDAGCMTANEFLRTMRSPGGESTKPTSGSSSYPHNTVA
eukprot:Rhum_TRINITY_DN14628_c1_g1::Rhum_TRINITY_DN14628_c1_g1_i1::g.104085::m.104085